MSAVGDARKRQRERAQAGAVDGLSRAVDAVADYADMEAERANHAETELAEARAVIAAVAALVERVCTCSPETRHWANCPTARLRAVLADPAAALATIWAEALREAAEDLACEGWPGPAAHLQRSADRIEGGA